MKYWRYWVAGLGLLLSIGTILVVQGATSPSITTDALPAGTRQQAYSVQLTSSLSSPTWTTDSALPNGLTLSKSGKLSGTPTTVWRQAVELTATKGDQTANSSLLLTVSDPLEYPSGTLIKQVGDPTVWKLQDNTLQGFRTPTEFLSYGYQWSWIVEVTAEELAIYPKDQVVDIQSGTLVIEPGSPTVYLVQGKTLLPFSSASVFLDLGYQWDGILTMVKNETRNYTKGAEMKSSQTHFASTKVKTANDATVYLLVETDGGLARRAMPSPGVFFSHGWRWQDVVTISAQEMALYEEADLLFYRDGTLLQNQSGGTRYVMEYEKKRAIKAGDHFEAMRYATENVIGIPKSELDAISTGSTLEAGSYRLGKLTEKRQQEQEALAQRRANQASWTESGSITTPVGTFAYSLVKATKEGTLVRTASAGTECDNNCAAKPLADYVVDFGGFAGIHGTYFCPPDYAYCNGQTYKYDSPVWDSKQNRWIWWDKRSWNFRGGLTFTDDYNWQGYWPGQDAPADGINAGIMNYPMLVHNGQIVASEANSDGGQRQKATRAAIGFNDSHILLVKVSSANIVDTAYVLRYLGATEALNLDGGGTTAIYHNGGYLTGPGRLLPNAIVLVKE